jgi:pantoate--beta-alanine ligase
MLTVSKKKELIRIIVSFREEKNQSVGFVPTMGFLHAGHGSLITKSITENGLTVCDIFVNPLQFNEKSDFENYPQDIEKDSQYLESLGCDILYLPEHNELYPKSHQPLQYDFGHLETVMEGANRPGHFQGVAEVVRLLFEIVTPDKAYFGEKDYQQLKIIELLVRQFGFPIQIVPCPLLREPDGLAMSSRNARLSDAERKTAPFIYQQLLWCCNNYKKHTPFQLQYAIEEKFKHNSAFNLEYIEFADSETLLPVKKWEDSNSVRAFIVARMREIRLIDNVILF